MTICVQRINIIPTKKFTLIKMMVPNHKKQLFNFQHLCFKIIIKFCILIEKLCSIVKIFISKFYNNLQIMNKIAVITVFKNKDTSK